MRQAESAALKAAGLTETGKKSGTFKRELAAVFSQVSFFESLVGGMDEMQGGRGCAEGYPSPAVDLFEEEVLLDALLKIELLNCNCSFDAS